MDAYLMIGCTGHLDHEGFISCKGVVNPILDLSQLPKEFKDKVIEFLDKPCGLFDKPATNQNVAANIVHMLYRDFNAIPEKTLLKVQGFIQMHKICGIYLMLILKEDYQNDRWSRYSRE